MKHESGVEVYLIPADGDGESLKYPELHYRQKLGWLQGMFGTKETQAEYQARDNCCFIRRHENQRFKIVQVVLSGPNGQGYEVPEYAESSDVDKDEKPEYCIVKETRRDCASPGTLTVIVQRGNHYWLDEKGKPQLEQSKNGPRGPLKERPRREYSFRNTQGKNGRKIRWQFRVRSLGRMLEIEKSNREKDGREPMSPEEKNDPLRYTLIRDEDFRLKEKQGCDYRMQLQKEYLEKMARKNRPFKPRRVRKQPRICECPKEHVGQVCKKRKAAAEIMENGVGEGSTARAKRPKASGASPQHSEVNRTSSIPLEEPSTTSTIGEEALVAPRACKKCRRYKKAPKGKKWFFDRLCERWMLAPIDAEDSFQPLADGEEADGETMQVVNGAEQNQTVRLAPTEQPTLQQDEDNEEVVDIESKPAGEETWTEEADEEIVQQVIGAEQDLVLTRPGTQQPLLQQDEDDQEIINSHQDNETKAVLHASEAETFRGTSARNNVHGALDQHQESDQVDSEVARIMTPTADFPATSIPASPKSPSAAEKRPGKIWTPLRFTLHLYDDNSAAKTNDGVDGERPGRIERSPPQISGTSNSRTFPPRLPFVDRNIWNDPTERLSGSSLAVSSTPRVKPEPRPSIGQSNNVVDLTGDSSSEIRAFKKEHTEEGESKSQHINVSSDDTEDEDEAELKDLQLRHKEVQLKIRMGELKRKMKLKAAAKRQSKVKQEIIEID
ncbi:unnamed protein product [Cercospora beticola]|nr:unnamed protein product [Cercospora beticola]